MNLQIHWFCSSWKYDVWGEGEREDREVSRTKKRVTENLGWESKGYTKKLGAIPRADVLLVFL